MNAHARDIPPDERPHAVVIGSGFGGLAAAIRLGARGYRVTIVEKLDAPGGRAYVYKQDGFTFDAGPTIITAPYLFEELWAVAGARMADDIDLRVMDPFYLIRFDDGVTMRCVADIESMRDEVAKIEPADVPGFERFLKDSEGIYEVAFKELADKPFHELKSLILAAPDLVRLGGFRSVYSKVCQYFTNEKLRVAFSFHPLLIGGNPFSTTAYYCLISHLERTHGVHFAMGGTGSIVNALAKLVTHVGGAFRYNAEVERINVENGAATGVTLKGGEFIAADIVVSNADAAFTYSKLLSHVKRRRWTDAKLARARYSMSLFVWYFGTNRKFDDVYHHMMVLGPRYRGLLKDIFNRKHLAEDFSLYLHRPTMTDPSLAPEGCDAFYALAPVPHLDSGTDWTQMAEPFRARIEKRLE
ncbi:MAG: phytoene desaturase, partial [Beijerinckiaceae bacterium]|nr:phytoene desaturase [Beijerinckiaceae bacterium]